MTIYGKYAKVRNIVVEQGTDWQIILNLTNNDGTAYDLTGYTNPKCQIRDSFSAANAIDVTVSMNSDQSDGEISLSLTNTETSNISFSDNKGVWDLEIDDVSGNTRRLVQGEVTIKPEVTRS
jgi:hypothetical protein